MTKQIKDVQQYVQQTADLIGLQIDPVYLPEIVDNFERIAAIASLVTEFELPENIESAPTFEP